VRADRLHNISAQPGEGVSSMLPFARRNCGGIYEQLLYGNEHSAAKGAFQLLWKPIPVRATTDLSNVCYRTEQGEGECYNGFEAARPAARRRTT
jgi:hypothetical protein